MSSKDQNDKKSGPDKSPKKIYKKPKVKVITIDKAIVHATSSCGCGY